MKQLINICKCFGINQIIVEGKGFSVAVINKQLVVNNPITCRIRLQEDVNSTDTLAKSYAKEIISILEDEDLI